MKNCSICGTQMKFMNTPPFGNGKLKDAGELCSKCFTKVANSGGKTSVKSFTLEDAKGIIDAKSESKQAAVDGYRIVSEHIASLDIPAKPGVLSRKEIKMLPEILHSDEVINHIVQGFYSGGIGVLVATNKRMVFVDKGLMYGLKVEEFPNDRVNSITYETGLTLGKIKIHSSGNVATIANVDKKAAKHFADHISNNILNKAANPVPATEAPAEDVIGQLERLSSLKDKGIISEEEFAAQKSKLLSKL